MTPRPGPARRRTAGTLPGHRPQPPGGTASVWDLAALDALAECLNRLGFPSLPLLGRTPPFVDVGLPGDMAPGERVYLWDGMFVWHGQAVGWGDQPAAAAAVITRALYTTATPPTQRL
jgi:hypothetical protein